MLETKLKNLAILCLVLGLTLTASAANVNWTGANANAEGLGYWDDPGNWDTYPTASDQAFLTDVANSTVVVDDFDDVNYPAKECLRLILGNSTNDITLWINSYEGSGPGGVFETSVVKMGQFGSQNTQIIVDAGEFNCNNLRVQQQTSAVGGSCFITVNGGVLNAGKLGLTEQPVEAQSTLTVNGGLVDVAGDLWMGASPAEVSINLNGGTLNVGGNFITTDALALDVIYGTLVLDGDQSALISQLVSSGQLTSFNGQSTLEVDYDVRNSGKTTLTAVHPLAINPVNGQLVGDGATTLTWKLLEPSLPGAIVTCDVFLGTDLDPQSPDYDYQKVISNQSVESYAVTLEPGKIYYWKIDVYEDGVLIFDAEVPASFNTGNAIPEVDAGGDITAWLTDGEAELDLAGTVQDDGKPAPYTVKWTVTSQPEGSNVVLTPASADTESLKVVCDSIGDYVLEFAADDTSDIGTDTITIHIFENACEATKSLPDYVPLVGDLNQDCQVGHLDFALLADDWLQNIELTSHYIEE